jgi:hypothetical protein
MFGRRKRAWVWVDTFPQPPKDVRQIMDRLTRLPVADAEKVLLRVIRECQEVGKFSQDLTLPSERRFLDRQYARAIEALTEIAEAGGEDDPSVEKARRALEVNRRALDQHRDTTAEWESPELRDFMHRAFGPEPESYD